MQTIAVDPAMIGALAPGRIRVQIAQLLWNPTFFAVRLMPDWTQRFEEALVFHQMRLAELLISTQAHTGR